MDLAVFKIDANAIAPQTAKILTYFGTSYADGGLIGPPTRQEGNDFVVKDSLLQKLVCGSNSLLGVKVITTEMNPSFIS